MKPGLLILFLKNSYPLGVILLFGINISCVKKNRLSDLPLKQTLRFTITAEPPTLDWNRSVDTTSGLILNNIMDGLVDYNFSNPHPQLSPALAEKWISSSDNKHWTFFIKKNILWSDGKKLTSYHIRDSWERLLNPKTASEYAYFLYSVKNAKSYNQGKITDFSQVGVKTKGPFQLLVELRRGLSYFPFLLAHSSLYPIRKDIIKKYGNKWTHPNNLISLGAYQLKSWEHDRRLVLKKNPQYYSSIQSSVKNIVIYIIEEFTTALSLFEQGRLDAIGGIPSRELPILKKKPEYKEQDILAIYYYGINISKKPFSDVRIRKAINYAIDRKKIIQLLNNSHVLLTGWIPKGLFGYDSSLGLPFNPQTARILLQSAGYSKQNPFPRITISYNTNEDHKRVAENIQAQLKKNLDIAVELINQEWKTYLQSLKIGKHDIYRLGWQADYPEPHTFMNLMSEWSTNNHTFWKNKNYDSLINLALALPNGIKKKSLYQKAQKILVETEVPVIPIYSSRTHWLIHKRIRSFPLNIMNKIQFKKVVFY